MDALSRIRYGNEIAGAARAHGLDPALLAAVAAQETGGPGSNSGANVVGDGGHGHGVFQIDDRWHAFATSPAAMDPGQNADYAAGMISGLLKEYGGNVHEALSAYNSGSPTATGTKTRWADGEDLGYADSVLRHYQRLTGGSPSAAPSAPPAEPDAAATQLAMQAQRLPLLPTIAPAISAGAPHFAPSFHRSATDYLGLLNDDTDEITS